MEQYQYQDFLCRIARQVDSLLVEDTSAIGRFRTHLQSFADKENKHLNWLKKQRECCLKKGNNFSISTDGVYCGGMKVPLKYETPACIFVRSATKQLPEPKSKSEEYQRYYITLALIHNHVLPTVEKIDNGILPKNTADFIWASFQEFWDSSSNRAFVEAAFKRVKADLARVPPETEQQIPPAKWRRIWPCVKGLAKELYGLTIERITKAWLDKYG